MSHIAERQVAGATIVKSICTSCKMGFWQRVHQQKAECPDCDPEFTQPEDHGGFGRNMDKKVSDKQYHGHYES